MGQPTTGRGRKGKMALGQSLKKNTFLIKINLKVKRRTLESKFIAIVLCASH